MKYGDALLCDPAALEGLDPSRTAHLCIDVQDYYFKDKGQEAEDVAARIALVSKAFGRAGLAREIYAYHMSVSERPDFFIVQPQEGDILAKKHFSAFEETNLHAQLKAQQIENIILSGGYAFDCVSATARDALERGYNVVILENCLYDPCDSDDALMLKTAFQNHSRYGERTQALVSTSGAVLQSLRRKSESVASEPSHSLP